MNRYLVALIIDLQACNFEPIFIIAADW